MNQGGRAVAVLVTGTALLVACSAHDPDRGSAAGARVSPTAEVGAADAAPPAAPTPVASGLPGEEALSEPPEDPGSAGRLAALSGLRPGVFAGQLELTLSGLAAFSEAIDGDCTSAPGTVSFDAVLSDGSAIQVRFTADGATSSVTATGIDVRQSLHVTSLMVTGASLSLQAGLLSAGTSEQSGSLTLEGTCG